MSFFIDNLFHDPPYYFCWVGSVAVSICIHEFAHAFTAFKLGDDTARTNGYLTLNPLKTMGNASLICLLLFGISWGAVPVAVHQKSPVRQSLISLAGPVSNLILAIVSSLLFRIFPWMIFYVACYANCMLFIFNILPLPILDGWGAIEPYFPVMQQIPAPKRSKIFYWFIFILWVTPVSNLMNQCIAACAKQLIILFQ